MLTPSHPALGWAASLALAFICGIVLDVDLGFVQIQGKQDDSPVATLAADLSAPEDAVHDAEQLADVAPGSVPFSALHHSTARSLLSLSEQVAEVGESAPASTARWPAHPKYSTCADFYRSQPYRWAKYLPTDPVLEAARRKIRRPTDKELEGTAIVTMATGDAAARSATALMQSLRDVGTRVPQLVVLLFRGGHGSKWCDDYPRKKAVRRARRGARGAIPSLRSISRPPLPALRRRLALLRPRRRGRGRRRFTRVYAGVGAPGRHVPGLRSRPRHGLDHRRPRDVVG